jgi:hypothetical protein
MVAGICTWAEAAPDVTVTDAGDVVIAAPSNLTVTGWPFHPAAPDTVTVTAEPTAPEVALRLTLPQVCAVAGTATPTKATAITSTISTRTILGYFFLIYSLLSRANN